jgi:hypothetical protein
MKYLINQYIDDKLDILDLTTLKEYIPPQNFNNIKKSTPLFSLFINEPLKRLKSSLFINDLLFCRLYNQFCRGQNNLNSKNQSITVSLNKNENIGHSCIIPTRVGIISKIKVLSRLCDILYTNVTLCHKIKKTGVYCIWRLNNLFNTCRCLPSRYKKCDIMSQRNAPCMNRLNMGCDIMSQEYLKN